MKIEVGKRYRSGNHEGRVIAVDRNHPDYPIIFLTDLGHTLFFTKEGHYGSIPRGYDLQEIPKSIWLNVYKDSVFRHSTKESADRYATDNTINKRIACIEVKEGDGLED